MKALGGLDLIKKTVVNCEFVPQYVKIKTKIIFEIKTEKFMGILIYYYHPHVRWLKYQRLSRVFFSIPGVNNFILFKHFDHKFSTGKY